MLSYLDKVGRKDIRRGLTLMSYTREIHLINPGFTCLGINTIWNCNNKIHGIENIILKHEADCTTLTLIHVVFIGLKWFFWSSSWSLWKVLFVVEALWSQLLYICYYTVKNLIAEGIIKWGGQLYFWGLLGDQISLFNNTFQIWYIRLLMRLSLKILFFLIKQNKKVLPKFRGKWN